MSRSRFYEEEDDPVLEDEEEDVEPKEEDDDPEPQYEDYGETYPDPEDEEV